MNGVRVRPMHVADLDAVVALERATAEAPHWAAAVYTRMASDPDETASGADEERLRDGAVGRSRRRALVAIVTDEGERREVLAGFVVGQITRFAVGEDGGRLESAGEIESVVVASTFRRQGLGLLLLEAMLAWIADAGAAYVTLEVRASSAGAIALYQSLGFAELGRRPRYYADPVEDAVLMRRLFRETNHGGSTTAPTATGE